MWTLGKRWLLALLLLSVLVACAGAEDGAPSTAVPVSTPTSGPETSSEATASTVESDPDFITVAIDAPSRFQDFADIDQFGNVIGFDPDVMADLASAAGFEYEFVVTGFRGLLESVANGEFDVAMSALIIPDRPQDGLTYTDPYLQVGQVLVVRANETSLTDPNDVQPGVSIGAQEFTSGEQAVREILGLSEPDLKLYPTKSAAMQALIDQEVDGVITDSDDADYYTSSYSQQLKVVGGEGQAAWITTKSYGIAVPSANETLLDRLNEAIAQTREEGKIDRLKRAWLVSDETINAGESLVGTPANELVIGITGELTDMDPAAREPNLISWEVKLNTMSGLYGYDPDNGLTPLLAEDLPVVSEDGLEYTIRLRAGLTFPDGSELTADDVRFSFSRAAGLGSFLINQTLKDDNDDGFADADAVRIVDPLTVTIVLQQPTGYFLSLLASPAYAIVSDTCFPPAFDPGSTCGGIGPYTIVEWEPGQQMRLRANPQWPGPAPAFVNVQLRFYQDSARMRRSLENEALDLAWTGLATTDVLALRDRAEFEYWQGPAAFKSYLVFEHDSAPWTSPRLREAVALAVDRQQLATEIFQDLRNPLFSPVPDHVAGHIAAEPQRDLALARSILTAAGYSADRKLEMTIYFVNDGRYGATEEAYAQALADQLAETELIEATIQGAPWEVFRPESIACNYPVYLLGWPSSGQPVAHGDAMSWIEYFITNTDRVCSNYESSAMDDLLEQALETVDQAERQALYGQMQELWAREFPTLDLTQEPRVAISLPKVDNVSINTLGLLHYDRLTKSGG
ncbi:MAG: ABC transporter substrate-binding protein [Candidatus Promineifilaceae bacterium]|nr:ABC transporter substrate-binding protein [Candidatus Promineifilaceae bacterium]